MPKPHKISNCWHHQILESDFDKAPDVYLPYFTHVLQNKTEDSKEMN